MRHSPAVFSLIAIALVSAGLLVWKTHRAPAPAAPRVAVTAGPSPRPITSPIADPLPESEISALTVDAPNPQPPAAQPMLPRLPEPQPPASVRPPQPQTAKPKPNKTPPEELPPAVPVARTALSLVGLDPDAEAIWMDTINDPSIPPDARKDLIEDLNEDGFPDPKHVTFDDLPLILNRIDLIEQLAPGALDDTNADAFAEAYKDLLNMADKALRQ